MELPKIKTKNLKTYSLKTISLLLILGIVISPIPIKPLLASEQGEITTYDEDTADWLNGQVESSSPGLFGRISNAFSSNEISGFLGVAADIARWILDKLLKISSVVAHKGGDILQETILLTAKNITNQMINSLYSGALREFENAYLIQDYKKLADDVAYRAVYNFNNELLLNQFGLAGQQLPVAVISAIKDLETKMQGRIAKELYNEGYELTTTTLKNLGIAIDSEQSSYNGRKKHLVNLVSKSRKNSFTTALAIEENNSSLKAQADLDTERQKIVGVLDDTGDNTSQSIESVVLDSSSGLDPESLEGKLKELKYEKIESVPLASDSGKYVFFKDDSSFNSFYLTPPNLIGEVVYLVVDNQGVVQELSTYTSDLGIRQVQASVVLSPMVNARVKQSDWNGLVKHPAGWVKDKFILPLANAQFNNLINDDGKTVDYIQNTLSNVLSSMVRFDFGVTRDKDGCPTGITGNTIWSENGELQPLTPPVNRFKCVTKLFGSLFSFPVKFFCGFLNAVGISLGICTGDNNLGTDVIPPPAPPTTAVEGIYNYDFYAGLDTTKQVAFKIFGEKTGFAGEADVTSHIKDNFGFYQITSDGQIVEGKDGPSVVIYGSGIPFADGIGPDMNNLIYQSPMILARKGGASLHWPGWDRRSGRLVGEQKFWLFLYFFTDGEENTSGYPVVWRDQITFGSMPTDQTDLYTTMVKPGNGVVLSPGPNFMENDLSYRNVTYGSNFSIGAFVEDLAKKINPGDDTAVNYWVRIHRLGGFGGEEDPLTNPSIPVDLKEKIREAQFTKVVVPPQDEGNQNPEMLPVNNGGGIRLDLNASEAYNIPFHGIYLLSLDINPMSETPEKQTSNNSAYMIINVEPQN